LIEVTIGLSSAGLVVGGQVSDAGGVPDAGGVSAGGVSADESPWATKLQNACSTNRPLVFGKPALLRPGGLGIPMQAFGWALASESWHIQVWAPFWMPSVTTAGEPACANVHGPE
jgi:hypothetical protein